MKQLSELVCFSFLLLLISCSKSNNQEITKDSIDSSKDSVAASGLDIQKIALLAISNNLPPDKVHSIIDEYYNKTLFSFEEDTEFFTKTIDTIAKKNNLSLKKTASIIFSYEYELNTKEEIIEDYLIGKENYEEAKHELESQQDE